MPVTDTNDRFDVFPGILNENEFYSHHFLAHVFKSRIKDWLSARAEEVAPAQRLGRLATGFFRQRAADPLAGGFAERLRWHRELHRPLLTALGFSLTPAEHEWRDDQPIPVWSLVGRHPAVPDLAVLPAFNPAQWIGQGEIPDTLDMTLTAEHFRIAELPSAYGAGRSAEDQLPPLPPRHPSRDAEIQTRDGTPADSTDPLGVGVQSPTWSLGKGGKGGNQTKTWADLLSDSLMAATRPPRFVLLIGVREWLLIDRFKWPANRFLRFDLDEILGQRQPATLEALYALLHREALCPDAGEGLLDTLDAESHKHDAGVSEDLKYALRDAIEQLGSEAARQLISEHGYSYAGSLKPLDAAALSTECVRLVYRLIFLFYIEARPELGYVPINKSEIYARGYSLESLRDLTLVDLHTTEAQHGRYFDKTIKRLFRLVAEGNRIADHRDGLHRAIATYALQERLRDLGADAILTLRVLEPAMGSAAFLNEVVNQLAETYLTRKQEELKRRIPHDQYAHELQKVRMRIADAQVFGVDLNPIATELAEVSLWLNAIYGETDAKGRPKPARVSWFGYQLFNGNSLVGARAQVFSASQLRANKKLRGSDGRSIDNPGCYLHAEPRRATLGAPRTDHEVYHFLLPDTGLCDYDNKSVKEHYGPELDQLKSWKKLLLEPLNEIELKRLGQLSARIDLLWRQHAEQLAKDRQATEDLLPVWPERGEGRVTSRLAKEETRTAGMLSEDGDIAPTAVSSW